MNAIKKILSAALCLCALVAAASPVHAAASGSLSQSSVAPGETFSVAISMEEATVSSLGVQITCENAQVVSGQWLQNGLMASFDMSKNKGVFSPGGAATLSGQIFRVTLKAANPGQASVSVTLIGKNGTQEVFRDTVTKTVTVPCPSHDFGDYETTDYLHKQTCANCGVTKTGQHRWDEGVQISENTCTQVGQIRKTCLDCGHSILTDMPREVHKPTDWIVDTQPQVGIPGSRHTECVTCHLVLETEVIPALEPEVTEPEVTEPEVTEPEVTEPEVTEPEVTEPEVTEPEVTEPEVTEPEVTQPEVTEPEVTQPEVTEPEVTEPEVTVPKVTEPEVTEPEVTVPEVTEPEVTVPEVTQPEEPHKPSFLPILILGGALVLGLVAFLWSRFR